MNLDLLVTSLLVAYSAVIVIVNVHQIWLERKFAITGTMVYAYHRLMVIGGICFIISRTIRYHINTSTANILSSIFFDFVTECLCSGFLIACYETKRTAEVACKINVSEEQMRSTQREQIVHNGVLFVSIVVSYSLQGAFNNQSYQVIFLFTVALVLLGAFAVVWISYFKLKKQLNSTPQNSSSTSDPLTSFIMYVIFISIFVPAALVYMGITIRNYLLVISNNPLIDTPENFKYWGYFDFFNALFMAVMTVYGFRKPPAENISSFRSDSMGSAHNRNKSTASVTSKRVNARASATENSRVSTLSKKTYSPSDADFSSPTAIECMTPAALECESPAPLLLTPNLSDVPLSDVEVSEVKSGAEV